MSFLNKIFPDPNEKIMKKNQIIVEKVNSLSSKYSKLSDIELKNAIYNYKNKILESQDYEQEMEDILEDVFAITKEASTRILKMTHFDVQVLAGYFLHKNYVCEMKTGEGKTLVATLPGVLNGLSGKGVHIVTVNDYLAKRDCFNMGKVYTFLGLSVGFIGHQTSMKLEILDSNEKTDEDEETSSSFFETVGNYKFKFTSVTRKEAYDLDILYGTNNEFGFDYLRDNMVDKKEDQVQRELNYTIVDEVDSILIDEARTPLIISAPSGGDKDQYYKFAQIVKRLNAETDYNIDEKMRTATLTEEGLAKIESMLGVANIYTDEGILLVHHLEEALKAEVLFNIDRDYVIKEGEIVIVDEFTGRLMPGRRYSQGLHQAIEAKEGVDIKNESITLATITLQNYFRMYNKLAGMTGTAITEAEEFSKIYNLETIVVPTNEPVIRLDKSDKIYKTEKAKFDAVIQDIRERYEKGQPVLIGTASIDKNELLDKLLDKAGLPHEVLNAKNHAREAEIIAQAGKSKSITVATNMAGRGVDIMLGGNPKEDEEYKKVKKLGGLYVVGTERHEARRIDNQLRGRSGRQGDPGESRFYVSLEDDLMRIFSPDRMKNMMNRMGIPDDLPIENKLVSRSLESAQKKVEGNNFDIRKHLVEYDDVLNNQRNLIYNKRNYLLENNENSREIILDFIKSEINQVVTFHAAQENSKEWDLKEISETMLTIFPLKEGVSGMEKILQNLREKNEKNVEKYREAIVKYLFDLAASSYALLEKDITPEILRGIEKNIILRVIDRLWIEHLENISSIRMGIGLRGYGQRDPLVEYKKEAYMAFDKMMDDIQNRIVYSIFKVKLITPENADNLKDIKMTGAEQKEQFNAFLKKDDIREKMNKETSSREGNAEKLRDKHGKKVGRNDPCPCGSGKKYKHCCGA
ncbi:preprotein translocase subunit SecA [Patescibacteria group bacterium]|nr:preprotein translocase subunit SecA [Patescibacteria group bacterium]